MTRLQEWFIHAWLHTPSRNVKCVSPQEMCRWNAGCVEVKCRLWVCGGEMQVMGVLIMTIMHGLNTPSRNVKCVLKKCEMCVPSRNV